MEDDVALAHRHSSRHRGALVRSDRCGCFCCVKTFAPGKIRDWIDEPGAPAVTALCPRCGVDSVIGDASGYPITTAFLGRMRARWFSGLRPLPGRDNA